MPDPATPWPTPLAEELAGRGPMPFRDFMAEALYAEDHGFYTQRDRRRSRRPTAQIEAIEAIAQPLVDAFTTFARAHRPHLVDQGPGTGLLTRYLLALLPEELLEEVEVTFVEPNLARRTRLLVLLQEFGVDGRVVGSPRGIGAGPAFVVAKELVGSFPVHWLERTEAGWREVHVTFQADAWKWEETLSGLPPSLERFLGTHASKTPVGDRYAVNLQARPWLANVANALEPGVVTVLDRAMPTPPGEDGSVQALQDGDPVPAYEAPGTVDISAGVDLGALRTQARALGLEDRTEHAGLGEAELAGLEGLVLATRGAF